VYYDGEPVGSGDVRLVRPRPAEVGAAETGERDDYGLWSRWFATAESDDAIIYFSVEAQGDIVGEVFLHDIDPTRSEALVGYRVFNIARRVSGIGTRALGLLVDWSISRGKLDSVVVITRTDNLASRRLAHRLGFSYMGLAREGRERVVYRRRLSGVTNG
jgi:RimJ/RimL family protein N-acetyltransferase